MAPASLAGQASRWLRKVFGGHQLVSERLIAPFTPVLLRKAANAPGVRPILVGSVWRKVWAMSLAIPIRPFLLPLVEGLQHGVGMPSGTAAMAATLQGFLDEEHDEEIGLMQLDIQNAFSAINKKELLQLIANEALPGFAQWTGLIRAFLARGMEIAIPAYAQQPPGAFLTAHCGVAQGDPLSSLLFGVGLALALQRAMREAEHRRAAAYMDDMVLVAPTCHLLAYYHAVCKHLQPLGLMVQPNKTNLVGRGPSSPGLQRALSDTRPCCPRGRSQTQVGNGLAMLTLTLSACCRCPRG